MEDLFKKFINAGVGFVSLTSDRFQSTIDKLVKESKLSEQEGQKIMDDLRKNTDTKRKELESQFTGIANRLMKGVGVATNADVEELKRSVRGTKSSTASGTSSTSKSGSKAASSTTAKAAGATKKAADKVSGAAGTAQKSAAAKAGAAKPASKPAAKPAAKKEAPKAADSGSEASNAS
jgi:polyhydroxyalkanoate synthesis regulator phasin